MKLMIYELLLDEKAERNKEVATGSGGNDVNGPVLSDGDVLEKESSCKDTVAWQVVPSSNYMLAIDEVSPLAGFWDSLYMGVWLGRARHAFPTQLLMRRMTPDQIRASRCPGCASEVTGGTCFGCQYFQKNALFADGFRDYSSVDDDKSSEINECHFSTASVVDEKLIASDNYDEPDESEALAKFKPCMLTPMRVRKVSNRSDV